MSRERLGCHVLAHISHDIKAKHERVAVVFRLIYCVNDFLTDFMRRLKSSNRLDSKENLMFRRPLWLLEQNFSRPRASGDQVPVRQQP